jgi:Fe-S cluster assembly ATPase SufC
VSNGVNSLRDPKRAVVLVTHYQRLLDYIVPDFVHVLSGGRIVKSGDRRWRWNWSAAATTGWCRRAKVA